MQHVHSLAEREQQLKDWESMLIAKEMELNGRSSGTPGCANVDGIVGKIYGVSNDLKVLTWPT